MEWIETIREKINGEIVVDGKTIRRSKDATEEKSNEITAIPELLKMLHIKGCIITIDAMGTQKDIARTIIEKEADYVLSKRIRLCCIMTLPYIFQRRKRIVTMQKQWRNHMVVMKPANAG